MIRRYSRVLAVVTTCMALTILAGCGGGDSPTKPTPPTPPPPPPPTPVATSITVTPSSHTLPAISATVQLMATVKDQNNNTMSGQTVTWSSANTAVATVSAQGLVSAVSNGTAQITARSGNSSGESDHYRCGAGADAGRDHAIVAYAGSDRRDSTARRRGARPAQQRIVGSVRDLVERRRSGGDCHCAGAGDSSE